MVHLLVEVNVQDIAKWKPVFEGMAGFRKSSGSLGAVVYRSENNQNRILVLTEWKTAAEARKFGGSDELKQAWQRAGVVGKPEVLFLDEVEHLPH
jgi:heme-degrading monooxygenase HmoA